MHALIPLLFALIALNRKQLQEDKLYRVSALSVVGASYFVLVQYILYYQRVFQSEGIYLYLPLLAVVIGVVGLCYSPWFRRSEIWKTCFFLGLFAIRTPLTYIFDISIKNAIAAAGGFFSNGSLPLGAPASEPDSGRTRSFPTIAHQMLVPEGWQAGSLATGHELIYLDNNGKRVAEIRPNCFTEVNLDTPTVLENNLWSLKATEHPHTISCSRNETATGCFIKVTYGEKQTPVERWRLIRTNHLTGVHSEVDVVLNSAEKWLHAEAAGILASVQPLDTAPTVSCTSPSAWL